MNTKHVVVGIFENEMYAIIAKRDLKVVGIRANILKEGGGVFIPLMNQAEGVQLMVPDNQVEKAREILKTKFI
jgi:hypothetical protein